MTGNSLTNSLTFSLGEMSLGNIAQGQVSRRSECVCVFARAHGHATRVLSFWLVRLEGCAYIHVSILYGIICLPDGHCP